MKYDIFESKAVEFAKSNNHWEFLTYNDIEYRADIEIDFDDEEYTYVIFYLSNNYPKHQHYVFSVKSGEVVDFEDRSDWHSEETA
jgi:hypothetical protein